MPTYSAFWIEEGKVARLRELWAETLPDGRPRYSTSAIGRELGCSKNAVIGKAQREGLPERACPIIRSPNDPRRGKGNNPKRAGLNTLAPLSSLTRPVKAAPAQPLAIGKSPPSPRLAPPPPRATTPVPVPIFGKIMKCCWPFGEPGTPSFRFCEEPSVPGKPYCPPHVTVAYVRIRDRREDEAA